MRFKPEWKSDLQHKTKHVDRVIAAERWLLEHSPAILANSRQVIAEIDDDYGGVLDRRAARVTTVPHGIGSPVAERLEQTVEPLAPAHSPKTNVLFVGRLEERKGPDQLLSALAHIPNVLDQMEVTFVGSAGRQGDAYSTRLTQMADSIRRKCPRATIRFVGYVSDTDLQRHYADADVFVAPSRYESFGLVLIEAMRHGTPVIACDVGGMREIISDGTEGFLVPVGDVARLADRLRLLVEQKELRATIGEAARQTYELRFTASNMVESLEEMFRSVIEENIDG
jgi:glycosyltransferase involved in cell wall biosynthesis